MGRVLGLCRGLKKKYECSLLCADKQPSAGRSGPGSGAPGCSCRRGEGGPGRPPGVAATAASAFRRRGRPLSSRDPGLSGARPAPPLGRPAPSKVSPAGELARQGPLGPRPTGRTGASAPGRQPPEARGARAPRAPGPDAGAGTPGAPPRRAPALGLAWPAGRTPARGTEPHSGPPRLPRERARQGAGDLPGPPVAGVILPRTPRWAAVLPECGPGARRRAGRAARPGLIGPPPPRAPRAQAQTRGPGAARPSPAWGRGRWPGCPPGHPRAMAQWGVEGQRDGGVGEAQAPTIKGWGWGPAALPMARPRA